MASWEYFIYSKSGRYSPEDIAKSLIKKGYEESITCKTVTKQNVNVDKFKFLGSEFDANINISNGAEGLMFSTGEGNEELVKRLFNVFQRRDIEVIMTAKLSALDYKSYFDDAPLEVEGKTYFAELKSEKEMMTQDYTPGIHFETQEQFDNSTKYKDTRYHYYDCIFDDIHFSDNVVIGQLEKCRFNRCTFENFDAESINFNDSVLTDCSIVNSNFKNCNFENVGLYQSQISKSDFTNANFATANMKRTRFDENNLSAVKFHGATLNDVIITDAIVDKPVEGLYSENISMDGATHQEVEASKNRIFSELKLEPVSFEQIAEQAKASLEPLPNSEPDVKFMWNGIKIDGVLYKGTYYSGSYKGVPEGSITVSMDRSNTPRIEGLEIENNSDIMTDYFEKDFVIIRPDSIYYNAALKAANDYQIRLEKKAINQYEKLAAKRIGTPMEEQYKQELERHKAALEKLQNQQTIKISETALETVPKSAEPIPKQTVVVNCFAGPGAGKTTCAWEIASELKKRGIEAEYVGEYAKELVWDGNTELLDGSLKSQQQLYDIQNHRVQRLIGKVDVVVTDSPAILGAMYLKQPNAEFERSIISDFNKQHNFNLFINRGVTFQQTGRIHNLEESKAIDNKIKEFLDRNEIYYGTYKHSTINKVVENIQTHLETANNIFLSSNHPADELVDEHGFYKPSISPNESILKLQQYTIISEFNPAPNTYQTWIRSIDDVKNFEETLKDSDWEDWEQNGFDESYSAQDVEDALITGKITVYSSYPIEQGVFVTPSFMEAKSYSSDGNIYSKEVDLNAVAWIDPTQGQYANVEEYAAQMVAEPGQTKIFESSIPIEPSDVPHMTLDEFLASRGLASPVDDFMIDKLKLPHGQSKYDERKMHENARKSSQEYHSMRDAAIKEYQEKVAAGEIIEPSVEERYIKKAMGNPDKQSVQAARRVLEKRGYIQNENGEWIKPPEVQTQAAEPTLAEQKIAEVKEKLNNPQTATKSLTNEEFDILKGEIVDIVKNYQADPKLAAELFAFKTQFYQYSLNNTLLIHLQNPHATFVASFTKWKSMGYSIKKGAKHMKISRPIEIAKFPRDANGKTKMIDVKNANAEEKAKIANGEIKVEKVKKFVPHQVFDISQTTCPPEDYPKIYSMGVPDIEKAQLYECIAEYAKDCGFSVAEEDMSSISLNGYYKPSDDSIHINSLLQDSKKLETMAHELAHGVLHKTTTQPTEIAEFEAESFGTMLQRKLGIPVSEDSKRYIKNYLDKSNSLTKAKFDMSDTLNRLSKAFKHVSTGIDNKVEEMGYGAPREKGRSLSQAKVQAVDPVKISSNFTQAL